MNVTTNELIPISENNGKRAVNARDLHAFLESKRDFSTWIKDRIKSYDFIEGVDFQSFTEIVEREIGATKRIEYALSISMAKELSMIENNERGRQARKYFIACEENKHELSRKELALMVVQAEEEKERLLLENNHLSETVNLQTEELQKAAPKVNYYDNHLQSVNTQTSTQVAKQIGMYAEKLHKKLKEIGIIYRQSGQWILHTPYSTFGLHSTRTQTYTRSDGSVGTSIYTVWTTKGVRFIISLYENDWNVKKSIEQIK
jgi:phage anti-repressor protein/phage antirepressor YoqD-like protein